MFDYYLQIRPNPDVKTLEKLPEEDVRDKTDFFGYPSAILKGGVQYYYCEYCKLWIEGRPHEFHEDTSGPLCGRRGMVTQCVRCTRELNFSGAHF